MALIQYSLPVITEENIHTVLFKCKSIYSMCATNLKMCMCVCTCVCVHAHTRTHSCMAVWICIEKMIEPVW